MWGFLSIVLKVIDLYLTSMTQLTVSNKSLLLHNYTHLLPHRWGLVYNNAVSSLFTSKELLVLEA
jgi:hypothetical protein